MDRRNFLHRSTLFAISTTMLPFDPGNLTLETNMRFGLTTDSHYADRDPRGTRYYRQSLDKMREFVEVMNREKVDFVIHLGDFKDEDQNKREQDTLEYLRKIEGIYAQFNGPRYHCIGNHDIDSISKQQFLENIKNTGIPAEKSYYSFDSKGYHFVVLDPNYHEDGRDHNNGDFQWFDAHIPDDQLRWLEEDLKKTNSPTIVFSHFALFEFTRGDHFYHVTDYQRLQQIIEASGKVKAVFQGHVHEERFKEINGIHYVTQYGMVDHSGLENNSFAIVEIKNGTLAIQGFHRVSSQKLT